MTAEKATEIMKDALVAYMCMPAKERRKHGIKNRSTVTIRKVYQNLPEFDERYARAKDILERAADIIHTLDINGEAL